MPKILPAHWEYQQPDFYHFSEDSIRLVDFVIQYLQRKQRKVTDCIDVGCGSGVIGIEFSLKWKDKCSLSLLELQSAFFPFIHQNLQNLLPTSSIELLQEDLFNCSLSRKYDLVLCNPPFFLARSSRPIENEYRRKCRQSSYDLEQWYKRLERIVSSCGVIAMCLQL